MFVAGTCDIKINLTLRVLGRRGDGYHDICSLFWRIRSPETVEVNFNAERDRLEVIGAEIPGENILWRVCRRIREIYGDESLPPIEMRLHKHLPTGSGVGAGSGNAAALVRLVRAAVCSKKDGLFHIESLGADVAFLASGYSLALASGIGEALEEIKESLRLVAVVFFPEWSADTNVAYRALDKARAESLVGVSSEGEAREEAALVLGRLRNGLRVGALPNDFIACAGHKDQYGAIAELSSASGALAWGLCGSGSAYFSLFTREGAKNGMKSLFETLRKKEKSEFNWLRQILVLE
jgi:4-diphosphocytidyl-2-C-methyl-D-erythritol kinase